MSGRLEDLAYLAGLFDGEGCITLKKGKRSREVYVQLGMTSFDVVAEFHRLFGGSLGVSRPLGHKPQLRWTATGTNAREFLEAVRPWLRVKAEQADIAFAYWETAIPRGRRHLGIPEDVEQERDSLVTQMRAAKEAG